MGGNISMEFLVASNVLRALAEEAQRELTEKEKELTEKEKEVFILNYTATKLIAEKEKEVFSLNYTATQFARDLMDASTEILRLKGKLDIRGMIEEIEEKLSPGNFRDPNTSRTKLWEVARQDPRHRVLFDALAACFPGQGEAAKDAAISTIKNIYKKASEMIHSHIDSNNVVVVLRHRDFPGSDEQLVIRALAESFHFKLDEQLLPP